MAFLIGLDAIYIFGMLIFWLKFMVKYAITISSSYFLVMNRSLNLI